MIQVQERAKKEDTASRKISASETWVSARFDDFYHMLSGEPRMAYFANQFLTSRPSETKFVEKLRNPETSWGDIFSTSSPWYSHYTLTVLLDCVEKLRKGDPEFEWVAKFGDKHHANIVDLVESLSQPQMAMMHDWPFCFGLAVQILEGLMIQCTSTPNVFDSRYWIALGSICSC
jgi:hypothetical protein